MKNGIKLAIAAGLGYAGFKLYQLNRLAAKLVYSVKGASAKVTLKPLYAALVLRMEVRNQTNASVKVKDTFGNIEIGGNVVGTFSTGPYTISKNGVTALNLKIVLRGLASAQALYAGLTTNRWPVVTINQTDLVAGVYPNISKTVVDLAKLKPTAAGDINAIPTVEQ